MTDSELILIDRRDFVRAGEPTGNRLEADRGVVCTSAENLATGRGRVVPRFARPPRQAAALPHRRRGEIRGSTRFR